MTTTHQDRKLQLLQVATDMAAWLNSHAEPLDVLSAMICRFTGGPALSAQVHISSSLAALPRLLAVIPQATVTSFAVDSGVRIEIAFTTGKDSLIVLTAYLKGEEALVLAQTAGLDYPARPAQAAVTTDTLAAAATTTAAGQVSDA
ncbi:hypothetical protein [Crossiella sp. CA198]|uniref:hypothetical protein n=1 Tax=Crossiella sp. CA198 TaxID=3455607 RepID=UPI003F8D1894